MKKERTVVVGGVEFLVPTWVQRLDGAKLKGWQLRYGKPTYFSDGQGTAAESLKACLSERRKRMREQPPIRQTSVRIRPLAHKADQTLPAGVSGPHIYIHNGTPHARWQVLLPLKNGRSRMASVYIGTANTWTERRAEEKLREAVSRRFEALLALDAPIRDWPATKPLPSGARLSQPSPGAARRRAPAEL